VWDCPDAILVCHKDVAVSPGEAVGRIEPFGMALDPCRLAGLTGTQKSEVADLLFGNDDIAIRQYQHTPWMLEPACKEIYLEPNPEHVALDLHMEG
jgi:galactose-1-phosphate uridylyltransferase